MWAVLSVSHPRGTPGNGRTTAAGGPAGAGTEQMGKSPAGPRCPRSGLSAEGGLSLTAFGRITCAVNVMVAMEATLGTLTAAQCSPGGYRDQQREDSRLGRRPPPCNPPPPQAACRGGRGAGEGRPHPPTMSRATDHIQPGRGKRGGDLQWPEPDFP